MVVAVLRRQRPQPGPGLAPRGLEMRDTRGHDRGIDLQRAIQDGHRAPRDWQFDAAELEMDIDAAGGAAITSRQRACLHCDRLAVEVVGLLGRDVVGRAVDFGRVVLKARKGAAGEGGDPLRRAQRPALGKDERVVPTEAGDAIAVAEPRELGWALDPG